MICKECKFWNRLKLVKNSWFIDNDKFGVCNKRGNVLSYSEIHEKKEINDSIVVRYNGESYFGEDFGCIHFKEKGK